MDFSDRLRIKQRSVIASANVPSFKATWTTGNTLTLVSGKPIVGTYANSTGIPSNTVITGISGNTVTISLSTTSPQTVATVAMTPSSASTTQYDSYEEKYNTQGGLSYLTFATGTPAYASTIGAFGCVGR